MVIYYIIHKFKIFVCLKKYKQHTTKMEKIKKRAVVLKMKI